MTYTVNLYAICVVHIRNIEAQSPKKAAELAAGNSMAIEAAIKAGNASYGEEIDGATVDVKVNGEYDYDRSLYFDYDHETEQFVQGQMTTLKSKFKKGKPA